MLPETRPLRRLVLPASPVATLEVSLACRAALAELLMGRSIRGLSVGVGVGSRPLPEHARWVREIVVGLHELGATPRIIPAMGSHGGHEAGQLAILARQGISPETIGAPIDADMATESLGSVPSGPELHWSRAALRCDLTLALNRVAEHPNLICRLQSGLSKMSVIGFGKVAGARAMHVSGVSSHLEAAAVHVRQRTNFVGGLAFLIDDVGRTLELAGVPATAMATRELELLDRARQLRLRLPFSEIDVLILDWFGKDISPTGIDRRVLGRMATGDPIRVGAVLALGLTPASAGNGLGVGIADAVTSAVVASIDADEMRHNHEASGDDEACTVRRVFDDDRAALRWAVREHGPRVVRAESTARLRTLLVGAELVADRYQERGEVPWQLGPDGMLDRSSVWNPTDG